MELELISDCATPLCQLSWGRIVNVSKYPHCIGGKEDEAVAFKSRRVLIKMAENTLDEIERVTDTKEATQIIQELFAFMEGEAKACKGESGEEQERRLSIKMKEKYLELQQSWRTK